MACHFWLWLRVFGGLVAVVALGGCAPQALTGEPVDLYAEQGGLRQRPAPGLGPAGPAMGPEAPYAPVMKPPRVQRVWLPAYVNDAGDLVSGHWVYLELQPSSWFLDDGVERPERQLRLNAPPDFVVKPHQRLILTPEQLGGGREGAAVEGEAAEREGE